jgi:hypothetical protein
MRLFRSSAILLCLVVGRFAFSQGLPAEPVRVTVSVNADGSRTTYRFNEAQRSAIGTTRNRDGKLLSKTRYTLDEAGRFATGEIYGPDSRLRFKSTYKYDGAGRQTQEVQSDKDDNVLHRIVYSYDSSGKPSGYLVYDAKGKVVSQMTLPSTSATPKKKKSR